MSIKGFSKESIAIALVGIIDLILTVYLIQHGYADEGNPIFSFLWSKGVLVFSLCKIILLGGCLFFIEWAKNHPKTRSEFIKRLLQGCLLSYVVMYSISTFGQFFIDDRKHCDPPPTLIYQEYKMITRGKNNK